jgi:hypothetical protein
VVSIHERCGTRLNGSVILLSAVDIPVMPGWDVTGSEDNLAFKIALERRWQPILEINLFRNLLALL